MLRDEFVNGINELKNIIGNSITTKVINDKHINGGMLISLAENYTDAINSGSVPTLQTAWNYMCENACNKIINNLVGDYKNYIKQNILPNIPQTSD
jgi:hypothetical protein